MHGVLPDVQPQRVLIQHRPVLQQVIQGDDSTCKDEGGDNPGSFGGFSLLILLQLNVTKRGNGKTCRLDVRHDALSHRPVIKHIGPLLRYSLVRVCQLWKPDSVIFLQDVSLRIAEHLAGKRKKKQEEAVKAAAPPTPDSPPGAPKRSRINAVHRPVYTHKHRRRRRRRQSLRPGLEDELIKFCGQGQMWPESISGCARTFFS